MTFLSARSPKSWIPTISLLVRALQKLISVPPHLNGIPYRSRFLRSDLPERLGHDDGDFAANRRSPPIEAEDFVDVQTFGLGKPKGLYSTNDVPGIGKSRPHFFPPSLPPFKSLHTRLLPSLHCIYYYITHPTFQAASRRAIWRSSRGRRQYLCIPFHKPI